MIRSFYVRWELELELKRKGDIFAATIGISAAAKTVFFVVGKHGNVQRQRDRLFAES